MLEWLAGGALGVIAASLGLGLLLWRERGKRSDAEKEAVDLRGRLKEAETSLARTESRAATLAVIVARKEARIRELETQLAAVDAGSLLDSVFGGVPEDPTAGDPSGTD